MEKAINILFIIIVYGKVYHLQLIDFIREKVCPLSNIF